MTFLILITMSGTREWLQDNYIPFVPRKGDTNNPQKQSIGKFWAIPKTKN